MGHLLSSLAILYHVIAQLKKAHSESYRASDFKSDERVARGRFEIRSSNTLELYYTKSYYQLIVWKTKCENTKSKENISE